MTTFFVGQRVKLARVCDPLDPESDDWGTVGEEGVVVGPGRYFADPEAGYDCVVAFPSYRNYCAWDWQLEPLTPSGHTAGQEGVCEELDKLLAGEIA